MEEDSVLLLQDSHDLNGSRTTSYNSRRSAVDGSEEAPIFGDDHPFRHISSREAVNNYDDLFTVSVKL